MIDIIEIETGMERLMPRHQQYKAAIIAKTKRGIFSKKADNLITVGSEPLTAE